MPSSANTTTFSIVRTDEPSGSYFGPNMKVSVIPEPASFALFGFGMGGSLLLRRRRSA